MFKNAVVICVITIFIQFQWWVFALWWVPAWQVLKSHIYQPSGGHKALTGPGSGCLQGANPDKAKVIMMAIEGL